jgi:hypothetical protein
MSSFEGLNMQFVISKGQCLSRSEVMPCRFKNKFSLYSTCPGNYSAPHQNVQRLAAPYSYSGHCGDRYCHCLLLQMVVEGLHWKCESICVWKSGNEEEGNV